MKRQTSVLLGLILGAVAALALTANAQAQQFREEFHQTYPLTADGSVSLKNISGAVHISTWAQNSVKVDAVKTADTQQELNRAQIVVENSPSRVSIRTQYPDNSWGDNDGRSSASIEYNITVPAGASLDKVSLVSGDLDIKGVRGEVRASSVSGDVSAEGLGGRTEISSVSGDVKVTFQRAVTRADLHSVSGDVIAVLPNDAGAEVRANTVSGDISNEFGLTVDQGQYVGRHLTGHIGNGDNTLDLHTVSGSIKLRRAAM